MEGICKARKAQGFASVLAIGTANPVNCVSQADFPDYYFRITKSEHMTELKDKFKRICERTMIKKRYFHLNEELMKEHPNIGTFMAPSLDARQGIVNEEIPKLGYEAAINAIKEWGQPKSKITHVVFCTSTAIQMPGADYQLAKLLDLSPSVDRLVFYALGCYGGGTVLRLAKDLAENNAGARILVVCAEVTVLGFQGPNENEMGCLVGQAIFGDGAGAVIVGADPDLSIERPLFQIVAAKQRTIPDSEDKVVGDVREMGLFVDLKAEIPQLISSNIEETLNEVFNPIGFKDWNSLFWVVHAGGRAILDKMEEKLGLDKEKFNATRHIQAEYGNMASAFALFALDEMRMRSLKQGKKTTGEGLELGVLLGLGPGLTIETLVLRSVPIDL